MNFQRSWFNSFYTLLMLTFSLLFMQQHKISKFYIFTERSTTIQFLIVYIVSDIKCWFSPYTLSMQNIYLSNEWGVTLSLKDGCFQAHFLTVFIFNILTHLSTKLGSLTYILGCFPLVLRPYHLRTVYYILRN